MFNIPTPKDDISGADVARVYYEEQGLERIKVYCERGCCCTNSTFFKNEGRLAR